MEGFSKIEKIGGGAHRVSIRVDTILKVMGGQEENQTRGWRDGSVVQSTC